MSRWFRTLLVLVAAIVVGSSLLSHGFGPARNTAEGPPVHDGGGSHPSASGVPAEALATLAAIERGGPFPYDRDGTVFQNREGRLPAQARGYYREYTVPTPGSRDRGARRIVAGGQPPRVFYYTDDHYGTFRRLEVSP
jgi:ribonuclease T1